MEHWLRCLFYILWGVSLVELLPIFGLGGLMMQSNSWGANATVPVEVYSDDWLVSILTNQLTPSPPFSFERATCP